MRPWFIETDIEKQTREEMQSRGLRLGIDFVVQYPIKYSFVLDIAFPDLKLAVELDGDYWHSRKKNRQRDRMKDNILAKKGWTVVRISGSEIKRDVSGCVDRILSESQKRGEQKF